ncbi:amidohydrolase family protein [Paenibacillus sp.]|uniref:amidohydrolase family protein n=1 Tax=Paenibacillus sp. TaxID=58172 RepID=UPI00281146A5|nr:amidohydrolase family protein [Paenibacillus sp.]
MRIDAHQHFWNVERLDYPILRGSALYRTVEPDALEPLLAPSGMDATIAVQAMDDCEETEYLLELADRWTWIAGVVGWVDLERPLEAGRQLERFAKHPKFVGVRHLIMTEPDPDWLIRPAVLEGLRVLSSFGKAFDVGAEFPRHLRHVPAAAEAAPELRFVIDHLAKPPIGTDGMVAWEAELERAAACPNVYAKLSGLPADGRTQAAVNAAFRCFGADRLLFGSDWPVSALHSSYERTVEAIRWAASAAGCTAEGEFAIFGGTARAVYRLEGQP